MQFEQGNIYHIYNQGNNRQAIFFERGNYLFFLKKMKENISPHANIIAWCLMPNHFHLMVEVREVLITPNTILEMKTHGVTSSHPVSKKQRSFRNDLIHPMTSSHRMNEKNKRSLNQSIAIMLRSYTRAINKQQNRSGSLFRPKTKAECISKTKGITPSFYNSKIGSIINTANPEMEYPQRCFDYIHQNPVKAGLVKQVEDWEFSSYQDYYGLRNGTLIERECSIKYGISIKP